MASAAADEVVSPVARLEVLFEELAELTGQRNAIDGRLAQLVAEIDGDGLWGASRVPVGARTGGLEDRDVPGQRADDGHRRPAPRAVPPVCAAGLRAGRFSLDQVGVIAERAAEGSDAHCAQVAAVATVTQLRTAITVAPRPHPDPTPEPRRSITKTETETAEYTSWKITLPKLEAATFEAALRSHRDTLVAQWTRAHADGSDVGAQSPPFPVAVDGFMSLIEASWDTEAARRPHGAHTTVVVYLDVEAQAASLQLRSRGSRRPNADTCSAMRPARSAFHRHGRVIDPPTNSPSPTNKAEHCVPAHWPAHRPHPHRQSHRMPDRPANAPTGGGMTPTNHNHRQRPTNEWTIREFATDPLT